jgi:hypothetical protein
MPNVSLQGAVHSQAMRDAGAASRECDPEPSP